MKLLLVIAPKDLPQLPLLKPLEQHFRIVVDPAPALPINPDAILAWDVRSTDPGHKAFEQIVAKSSNLKWVHTPSAGVENFISAALRERDIAVTNAKGVFADSLAEFAITGMLYFAKEIPRMLRNQREARWDKFSVRCMSKLKVGVVGLGGIGQAIAYKAAILGADVTAFLNRSSAEAAHEKITLRPISDLDGLLPSFDFITSSLPHTKETEHFFNGARLSKMNSTAVFINVGRGATVDEAALVSLLQTNKIGGAALDVFEIEPLPPESPLWRLENVLLSPHTADRTTTWLDESMSVFVENARRFAQGEQLINIVDKHRGY